VEYYLTESGKKILPIIALMERWGNQNKDEVRKISETLALVQSIKLARGNAPDLLE
jgi:DNA-binding HxlR family transcriptional regulator